LRASEIEALTFIFTPAQRSPSAGSARPLNPSGHLAVRPVLGAAVALVVFVALAWLLTPR
jgi:hypothetical protein